MDGDYTFDNDDDGFDLGSLKFQLARSKYKKKTFYLTRAQFGSSKHT